MKRMMTKVLLATAGLFGMTAVLAEFDGSEPLMCSLGELVECDYGAECRSVTNDEVAAPDFIRIDFRKKEFVAITDGISSEPDAVDNVQTLDNHLIARCRRDDLLGVHERLFATGKGRGRVGRLSLPRGRWYRPHGKVQRDHDRPTGDLYRE